MQQMAYMLPNLAALWCECRAAPQLTELTIRRTVQKDIPWLATIVGAFGGPKLDVADYPTAPEAVSDLPWEAQDTGKAEVVIGADVLNSSL